MKKVAVIGAGNWGKNHVRTFNQLGALWGFAELDDKTRAVQAELYPQARAVASLQEVIDSGAVDAVAVATPAEAHYEACKAALSAGLHVFVEKPITLQTAHARHLVELADEKGLILMVGHLMLYHAGMRKLKELAENGELGDLLYAYASRLNLGKVRQEENAMWSLAPHDISMIMHLFDAKPVRVSATGACYTQPELGVEDVVFMNMVFSDGRTAAVQSSWLDPTKTRCLTLIGSRKMVVFDDGAPSEKLKLFDKGVKGPFNRAEHGLDGVNLYDEGYTAIELEPVSPLEAECRHFLDCLESGAVPLTDGRNGRDVLQVLDAAQQSLKNGGEPVELS